MMMNDTAPADAPGIDEYAKVLWRRKFIVLLAVIGCFFLASLYAGSTTEMFTAEARVVLGPLPGEIGAIAEPVLDAEAERMQSNERTDSVIATTGIAADRKAVQQDLEVLFTPDSDVLRVKFSTTDPEMAAKVANAFASSYLAEREGQANKFFQDKLAVLNADLTELSKRIQDQEAIIFERNNWIQGELVKYPTAAPPAAVQDQLAAWRTEVGRAQAEVARAEGDRAALLNDRSDIVAQSRVRVKSAEISRSARVPEAPDGLGRNAIKAIGILAGLILGAIAAFVLDRFDRTARGERDVETMLGAPVLASVPSFPGSSANGLVTLRTTSGKKAAAARDSFRRLRSTLDFVSKRNDLHTFLVTSPRPGEGKSVTATNWAISAAQTGRKVVLVSCDLHRPTIERMLSLPEHAGVSEFLLDESEAILCEVPDIPNLSVVTAGRPVDNPAELLASHRISELLKHLEESHDVVILDTPPVLNASDALGLANRVDGVVVVCDSRRTETGELEELRNELELVGARIVGAVVNRRRQVMKRNSYAYSPTARTAVR